MDTEDIDYYLAMEEKVQMEQDDMEPWDDADDTMQTQAAPAETAALNGKVAIAQITTSPAVNVARLDFHTKEKESIADRNTANQVLKDGAVTAKLNSYTAAAKSRATNPKDFALAMQAERRRALGESDDHEQGAAARRVVTMDAESMLYTTRSPLYMCVNAGRFLHDRPPTASELADISTDAKGIESGYMPCVLGDGSRMYLYKRQQKGVQETQEFGSPGASVRKAVSSPIFSKALLSKPMSELMKEADALKVKALLQKDAHMVEVAARLERDLHMDVAHDGAAASAEDGSLWVDKYAPRSFTQLLSPEKINREVLKAVKKWDQFVFKHDHNAGDDGAAGDVSQGMMGLGNSGSKPPRPPSSTTNAATDGSSEDTRPRNKVILLCGPPGTGKTTLAHIVATHCGYTPMEVNASDDRSPERLKEILHNATQNSTLLSHSKPNCVILDEIDGIDGSRNALDVLVNIIKAPLRSAVSAKTKAVPGVFPLTRPLICICNDQYAPALRDLIKLADVFVFTAPQDVRLIQRLRQVCKQEGLQVGNSSYLSELCSATGFDIRSSINNLQFAALRTIQHHPELQSPPVAASAGGGTNWGTAFGGGSAPSKEHTATAPKALDIGSVLQNMIRTGLKDDSLDLSQIWRQMFTLNSGSNGHSAAPAQGDSAEDGAVPSAAQGRVDHSMRAMDAMLSFGDHQQVIAGIHENVHSIEALDPSMNKRTILAEWLSFTEELQAFMPRGRDGFQLMPYVAAIAGAVYSHCAVAPVRRPKVEWPRKDKEMHYKGVQKQNILQTVHDASSIHALLTSKQRVVLDMLPYLMDVISPPSTIRALPFITLPAPEQHAIMDVVKVMESCGLSYTLTKVFDTTSNSSFGSFNKGAGWGGANKPNSPFQPRPFGNGGSNFPQSSELVLMLDPAFDQLLQYGAAGSATVCEELALRHVPVSPEMRQILQAEQRKYSIQIKAQKLDNDAAPTHANAHHGHGHSTYSSNFSVTAAAAHPSTVGGPTKTASNNSVSSAAAHEAMTESTPYLIMQQQQRDSSLTKRQHSGAMESFFKKSAVAPIMKKAKVSTEADELAQAAAPQEKKATFNANSIRFKFNQGFSNAVKRTVLMDEFL